MIYLRPLAETDRALLQNLFNIMYSERAQYTSELSDIDANGYYDVRATDPYFAGDESVLPYLILSDSFVVGCVIMTRAPYVKPGCEFCLQELFVLPKHRGKGIATEVCARLFEANPGKWCSLAFTADARAVKFWQDLISLCGQLTASGRLDAESAYFEFTAPPVK